MDVLTLSELLNDSSSVDNNHRRGGSTDPSTLTPGSFWPQKQFREDRKRDTANREAVDDDIWCADELPTGGTVEDYSDGTTPPVPAYEVYFRQDVGTEDVFLGTSCKTPGSMDCTHLVVKIHFPGCLVKNLNLEVTTDRLTAESFFPEKK